MEALEMQLKEMIINRYGSLKRFCETIDMPWTTLNSILNRGVVNSNITNVLKITKELGLDTESLAVGIFAASQYSKPLPESENRLLEDYRTLNDLGQQEATKRVHELTLIPSYVEDQFFGHPIEDNDLIPVAAHHQPGINGTEENALEEVERLRGKYGKKD